MTVPAQMAAPTEGAATTMSQIEVEWVALTTAEETGASPITSYVLEWDQASGGGVWANLVGEGSAYTATSHTQTTDVTAGLTY